MRALLAEPRYPEHLHHVVPLVEPFLDRFGRVLVTLPPRARQSPFFEPLAALAGRRGLEIAADAPEAGAASEIELSPRERRRHLRRVAGYLAERVRRERPSLVVVPTADGIDASFYRGLGRAVRRRTRIVLGYHWAAAEEDAGSRLARFLPPLRPYSLLWRAHRHRGVRCLLQDHTVLDALWRSRPEAAARVGLMPFAARVGETVPRAAARRRLGLPEQAVLVGVTGSIQERKDVAPLLRCASRSPRLAHVAFALVGPFQAGLERALAAEFGSLRQQGRLILEDRVLDSSGVWLALNAFDCVVSSYSPRNRGLSAVALLAFRSHCPVVGAATPWLRSMAQRTRHVHPVERPHDPEQLASALLRALDAEQRPSPIRGESPLLGGVEAYRRAIAAAAELDPPGLVAASPASPGSGRQ